METAASATRNKGSLYHNGGFDKYLLDGVLIWKINKKCKKKHDFCQFKYWHSPYNINQITDQVTKIRSHLFDSLQGHSKCEYYAYYKNTLKFTYISESLNLPCHFSSYKKVLRIKSVESGCKRWTFRSRLRVLHKVFICIAYIRLSSEYNLTNQFEFKFVFKIHRDATYK